MENELKAIEQQLQYALDELQKKQPDKQLLYDWISDPLQRVKKLIIPDVVGQSEQLCECYEPDDTTAMNCKHCGQPQFMHY